jgi:hypothetical protein
MTQVAEGTVRLAPADFYKVAQSTHAASGPTSQVRVTSSLDTARDAQLSTLEQVVEYLKVLYR